MNALTLFMATGCIASIVLFTITVIQQKIENKKRKNSYYDFLGKL